MFSVLEQRKIANIVMLKFVRVGVKRAYKIGVLNHSEHETLWDGAQDGDVDRKGICSGGECERLEFDSCQVIPRETPLLSVQL